MSGGHATEHKGHDDHHAAPSIGGGGGYNGMEKVTKDVGLAVGGVLLFGAALGITPFV
ncbi:hypothetical protein KBB25_01960 [Candidatus Gracilibacteria bacterium]|nr:hypothetical protein [Candidatus Gracilibacteria bacterium]